MLENIITGFIFVVGLIVGSFLNVMALRLLSEEDFLMKRSKCPKCQTQIKWYDNIPILSYLFLRGKCRNCGEGISIQYPIVELSTALLFLFIFINWGLSLKTAFLFFLTANLIVITITDLREKYIYDINSIPIIPLGLVYNFLNLGGENMLISAVIGAVIGAAFFEIFSRLGLVLAGEYAFGTGDTLLGAALGAWFGWKMLIAILVISMLVQVVIGIPFIIYNQLKHRDYVSMVAIGGLMVSLALSALSKKFVASGDEMTALGIILLTFILAGISVFVIFKKMREKENHTFMPFGPPLVIAAFIVMFFEEWISGVELLKLL